MLKPLSSMLKKLRTMMRCKLELWSIGAQPANRSDLNQKQSGMESKRCSDSECGGFSWPILLG